MNIDGKEYKFFEITYPLYALSVHENKQQAYGQYIWYISDNEPETTLRTIKEVEYEYAKKKYMEYKNLIARPFLEKLLFEDVVKSTVTDSKSGDDNFLLCELDGM